jgi:Monogalactosyldiacylglycerol (MGDG) synthase
MKSHFVHSASTRRQFLASWVVVLAAVLASQLLASDAFVPSSSSFDSSRHRSQLRQQLQRRHHHRTRHASHFVIVAGRSHHVPWSSSSLRASETTISGGSDGDDDVCTVQILMSDTGGGHRASANALRDAFDALYPGKFEVDIVDIYTEYGPFWPYNDYVAMYRIMSKYTWMWDLFYKFGETDLGLWLNEFLLTTFCYGPFKECMAGRVFDSTGERADMVVSVHPLCQDIPLKILSELDAGRSSKTPFATVVTDLGGAHTTWFNPG